MPTLSICIPTYNRSSCLAELLDSIIAQGLSGIEVIVSDDASPDDTAAVADRYKERIAQFTFLRQPVNIGLDRNFIAVTDAARGDYLWLMGDDDRLEPGGARRVLDALDRWPGVTGLTLGVIDYDRTMTRVTGVRRMPETQVLHGASDVFGTIAELLGFMSAMVVDRRRWIEASADPNAKTMNNLYTQVFIAGRMIGAKGGWGVIKEPCVGFRSDNDQFKKKLGWLERLKVDARAYDEIAGLLFADDPATRLAMRRRIFDTHILARIINAKTDGSAGAGAIGAAPYLINRYSRMRRLWTYGLPMLLAPAGVLRNARAVYQRLSRTSGTARAHQMNRPT